MAKKRKPIQGAVADGLQKSLSGLSLRLDALDKNPTIRAALIARIVKAAETAPVIMLHQIALSLDMANGK